ncbi:MAG: Sua5 family C-terminal domain-containing protein, partial [Pontixanthobacter sp.]
LFGVPIRSGDIKQKVEAPGQLARHYSPGKPVRLHAETAAEHEFHIGFGEITGHHTISRLGDLEEAAANLYAALHVGAKSNHPKIAVAPIPNFGIGVAINDRLKRAAA